MYVHEELQCAVSDNIHTSPKEMTFSKTSTPLWKFQLSFLSLFNFFGLLEPPPHPPPSQAPRKKKKPFCVCVCVGGGMWEYGYLDY